MTHDRVDIIIETLTLTLPTDVYQQLATIASIEQDDPGGRALREAGLLTELGPELKRLADPTISLEEVSAALSQVKGPSLTEIVLEQRRSKQW